MKWNEKTKQKKRMKLIELTDHFFLLFSSSSLLYITIYSLLSFLSRILGTIIILKQKINKFLRLLFGLILYIWSSSLELLVVTFEFLLNL